MRLIDADLAIEQLKDLYNWWEREKLGFSAWAVANCITKISELPTIDAVPVIRCKDCIFYEHESEEWGICRSTCAGMPSIGYCITKISELPTIDAVPVIRCKDCIFYEHESEEWGICRSTGAGMPSMGFCSDSERRKE